MRVKRLKKLFALTMSGAMLLSLLSALPARRGYAEPIPAPSTAGIATVAGGGAPASGIGDEGPALAAKLDYAAGAAIDDEGKFLYIAESDSNRVRKVDLTSGLIATVAGGGNLASGSGDGGPATDAKLDSPQGVALDGTDLYIAESGSHRIRKVDLGSGTITTVAGTGTVGYMGDGGPAADAQLNNPRGVAVDSEGHDLYIAEYGYSQIRKVDLDSGIITTVAGSATSGFFGDGGDATAAQLHFPGGIAVDSEGDNLYIADSYNHRIRKVDLTSGIITTVAGDGTEAYGGDGGPATSAQLNYPRGVAVDGDILYIADTFNDRIRKVDLNSGFISTAVGDGTPGFGGDNGLATAAQLYWPDELAIDSEGNLYIADFANHRIRKAGELKDSAISPTEAEFDKNPDSSDYADVTVALTGNGNVLGGIVSGAAPLVFGADYGVTGSTVVVKKEYLASQATGTVNLTFNFSAGTAQTLSIEVSDTTPSGSGWTSAFVLPGDFQGHEGMATAALDGVIYVAGGVKGGALSDAFWAYDVDSQTWDELAPLPSKRSHFSLIPVDGKLYIVGGNGEGTTSSGMPLADAHRYDPATGAWSQVNGTDSVLTTNAPRVYYGAGVVGDKIYILDPFSFMDKILEYDTAADAWSSKSSPLEMSRANASVAVSGGKIYLFGGGSPIDSSVVDDVAVYDPADNTYAILPASSTAANWSARWMSAAAALVDGRVVVVGGTAAGDVLSAVSIYDPAKHAWEAGTDLPAGRSRANAVVVYEDGYPYVYLIGGTNDSGSPFDTAIKYKIPLALDAVGIDVAAGRLTGTSGAMEYSLNSTDGTDGDWAAASDGSTAVSFAPGPVYVREAADPANSRLVATIAPPAPAPSVIADLGGGLSVIKLIGATAAMEYSLDGGASWSAVTTGLAGGAETLDATAPADLRVRTAATAAALPSEMTHQLNIMLPFPIVIVLHPGDVKVKAGEDASFTVAAIGTALSYQWQADTGDGFADLDGETAATLHLAGVTESMNGYRYRAKVADAGGWAWSNAATLTVDPPGAPSADLKLTAAAGDRQVALSWNTVVGATYYDLFMRESAGQYGASPLVTVTDGSAYTARDLTNGATYYFVVQAGSPGGVLAKSDEVGATPRSGGGDDGGNNGGGDDGGNSGGGDDGGNNGGGDDGGNSGGGDDGGNNGGGNNGGNNGGGKGGRGNNGTASPDPVPASPADAGVEVLVNGRAENMGTAAYSERGGQTVLTIAIDARMLEERLAAEGEGAVVVIPAAAAADIVIGELDGRMMKLLKDRLAVLEIRTDRAIYTLPAQRIDMDDIARQFGPSVAWEDIKVQIEIAAPDPEMTSIAERAAAEGGFALAVAPLSFAVRAVYGETAIEVAKFDAYVERAIALPEGADPSKVTTGVVIEPDGTVRHVPTRVERIDGIYYATINSLTNSTYALVWHPLAFADVNGHWSASTINDMGSRMIVDGIGGGLFRPDGDITRAEFAAIVVRALGLKPEAGAPFSDVAATDWYSGAAGTARAYGLVDGFEDGTFRPHDNITREQAMVVMARAMAITGLGDGLQAGSADELLRPFADAGDVSDWARRGAADSLLAGVVTGRSAAALAPKDHMTRAEAAAMTARLLRQSGLI